MSNEMTTTLTAAPGGIMTDEVGVITGEVEIRSTVTDAGHASAQTRYAGADEWYTITEAAEHLGSPTELPIYHTKLVAKYLGPEQ
ncbi:hypothetical protein [Nocardia brasiliensis]|uniref:hypothetical protein n=1 Tax=Nocardia brasiliensis TaxID=37326 RepID=UPI003D8C9E27